ncbi:MAG: hypothetical protein LWW95_08105 [Candidatus Desulfofervidus auxilii]|nr:hypothetical protein [Candidatus Desulfofervidus auxilii]
MFYKELDRHVMCILYFNKDEYKEIIKKMAEDYGIDLEEIFLRFCRWLCLEQLDKEKLLKGKIEKMVDPVIPYFYSLPIDVRVALKWVYDVDVEDPSRLKKILLGLITSNPEVQKYLIDVEKIELKNISEDKLNKAIKDPIVSYFSTLPNHIRALIKAIYKVDIENPAHLKEVLLKLITFPLKQHLFKPIKEIIKPKEIRHQRYGYLSCPFCGKNHNLSKQKSDRAGIYVTYCYLRKIKFVLHRKNLRGLKEYGIFPYKKDHCETFTRRFDIKDLKCVVPLTLVKNLSFYCPFCKKKHDVEFKKSRSVLKVFCKDAEMDIIFYDIEDVVHGNPFFVRWEL